MNINDGFVSLNENGYELHKTMLQVRNNTKKLMSKKQKQKTMENSLIILSVVFFNYRNYYCHSCLSIKKRQSTLKEELQITTEYYEVIKVKKRNFIFE